MKNTLNKEEFTPDQAYWNQRSVIAGSKEKIMALCDAVDKKTDLSPYQWAQLMAFTLEFKPDLILELGRGKGNSTCVFTEAANILRPYECRVLSLCITDDWKVETASRVRKIVPEVWFGPLKALKTDILKFDYEKALEGYNRILVFWDAHGFEVAECVLGKILPLIVNRSHVVIMHDMSDARYAAPANKKYGGNGLWKGNNDGPRLRIGHIDSAVEQAVAIVDFTSRNEISLESADHGLHTFFKDNPGKMDVMKRLLGNDFFSLSAHWFWFTLNEKPGPYTFPKFVKPVEARRTFSQRLHKAVSILLGWERF
jgi:hypothetical protein